MSAADKTCGSTCPRNANFRALRSRHWSQRHLVGKSLLVERNWVRFVQTGFGQRQPISSANSLPALTKLVGRFALGFHLRGGSTLKDGLQLHRAIRIGWRQVGLPHCCSLDRNASYLLGLARSVDHSKQIITFAQSLDGADSSSRRIIE